MAQRIDCTGARFGRLVAEKLWGTDHAGRTTWLCRCDCGGTAIVTGKRLRGGHTKSCGCLQRESRGKSTLKHGESNSTPEYRCWLAMRRRCLSVKCNDYPCYGGRGIRICGRWELFENFLADMGRKPTPQHSIDRIDNNGHYEPGNCRWATHAAQNNNRRDNAIVEYGGRKMSLAEAAREFGIEYGTLKARLRRYGWSVERALTVPPRPRGEIKPRTDSEARG